MKSSKKGNEMKCPYCKRGLVEPDWKIVEHIKECEKNVGKLSLKVYLHFDEDVQPATVELKAPDYWSLKEKLDKWMEFVKVDLNL